MLDLGGRTRRPLFDHSCVLESGVEMMGHQAPPRIVTVDSRVMGGRRRERPASGLV